MSRIPKFSMYLCCPTRPPRPPATDAVLHLGNDDTGSDETMRDIDLMTQSHLLVGGHSTFFQLAVHLCDSCVVASQAVASDAARIDEAVGAPWPRAYTLVNLHHHDSAADQEFEALSFGKALAAVLKAKRKGEKEGWQPAPSSLVPGPTSTRSPTRNDGW